VKRGEIEEMRGSHRAATEQQRDPKEAPGGEPEAVRVHMLGGFRVSVGTRVIGEGEWRLKKAESLIKLLALAEGHRLHREQAMEWLWPDLDPEAAANNLHHALHVARRALEPASPASAASRYLHLRDEQLILCPEGLLWVDVEAFEEAAATARHAHEPSAYRAAIELYEGELLPQDRYEAWVEEKRDELRQLYHALLLELAGLYEEREEYSPAIESLRRVVAEEPTKEEAHVGLMRLYALRGQQREAILQYERLQKALREELDEEPGDISQRLCEEIRTGQLPGASTLSDGRPFEEPASSSRNNLPTSLTSFVGREREMLEVRRLLSMTRLLTLTGAGGSGKTRLALEVAGDLLGAYPDGVWLVELAPLSDPVLVAQALAQVLGVREQLGRPLEDTLKDYLRTKNLLLVLDNCEHLVDAVAHLVEVLLRSCPKLRILATSREPLGILGEAVWAVSPLSLPGADEESTIEGLMRYEAIGLFVDRARSRLPDFELTKENAGAAVRVCRGLDGIPLAIELATARMGALTVEQVAERLENSLKLLSTGARTTEPRHQTMRATLEWSY
jgi:DNA-binding SARP family transcriptional activator